MLTRTPPASRSATAISAAEVRNDRLLVWVFTATIFLNAALLFAVQPMFSRMVLPLFGGSPAVWTTCMLFFQTVLLAGYFYAHVAPRWLGLRKQALVHLALLLLSRIRARALARPDSAASRGRRRVPRSHKSASLFRFFRVIPPFFLWRLRYNRIIGTRQALVRYLGEGCGRLSRESFRVPTHSGASLQMTRALANVCGDSRLVPGASPIRSFVLPSRDEAAEVQTAVLAVSEFLDEFGLASRHRTRASALQFVR